MVLKQRRHSSTFGIHLDGEDQDGLAHTNSKSNNGNISSVIVEDAAEYPDEEAEIEISRDEKASWRTAWIDWRLLWLYTGPGFLMSLAYLDPGNLESDLQNGAIGEYTLLWVLAWSTFFGFVLQALASKLGVVTNKSLAQVARAEYTPWLRYLVWIMTEIAIIGSDTQEVLGSAIAWQILFGIPIWAGVLLTGIDTFVFLGLHYFGVRAIEALIFTLLMTMLICFWINMFFAQPSASGIVLGTLNFTELPSYAVNLAVGTIGAVIMPHNLYLHSAIVRSRKVDRSQETKVRTAIKYNKLESAMSLFLSFLINLSVLSTFAALYFNITCARDGKASMPLSMCDPDEYVIDPSTGDPLCCQDIGLSTVADTFSTTLGTSGLYIWAIGLLAAGQASTLTGTLAGQYVMEGFLHIRLPVWKRLLLTRSIALIPSIAVGILSSQNSSLTDQVNQWLNVLQAVQLPFALLPVLQFTSDRNIMGNYTNSLFVQTTCWVLAVLLLIVNFIAIFQQYYSVEATSSGIDALFYIAFLIYLGLVLFVAYPGVRIFSSTVSKAVHNFRRRFKPGSLEVEDEETEQQEEEEVVEDQSSTENK